MNIEGISHHHPLGPIDSEDITDMNFEYYFSKLNPAFEDSLQSDPSFLVGRKGSGKTTMLKATRLSKNYKIVVDINKREFFVYISQRLITDDKYYLFVESVAGICEEYLFSHLAKQMVEKTEINEDQKLKLRKYIDKNNFCNDTLSLSDLKLQVTNLLKERRWKAAILIDNLENSDILFDSTNKLITQGLLFSIGRFNNKAENKPVSIRCSIPQEIYPRFFEISSNSLKDFENTMFLSWSPREILAMIAKRLELSRTVLGLEMDSLKEFRKNSLFIMNILPQEINNAVNLKESAITYILRHTQLLPRQVLMYFNKILKLCFENSTQGNIQKKITPGLIVRAIDAYETTFAADTVSAYKHIFPEAHSVFKECIPDLRPVFKYGDLDKLHNRFSNQMDYDYFLSLFFETGCVGVVDSITEQYVNGLFRYTSPIPLNPNKQAKLCLHPIFTKYFNGLPPEDGQYAVFPVVSHIGGNALQMKDNLD